MKPSKIIQISTVLHPGQDQVCGPHTQIFALDDFGKIWIKTYGYRYSNTEGKNEDNWTLLESNGKEVL